MAFTYSGNPLASTRDQARFLLGDVVSSAAKLSDEEFDYLLTEWDDDPYATAAAAADIISNNAAAYYSFTADGGSSSIGDLQERYKAVARTIRQTRAQRGFSVFYVGGIDPADVDAHDNDQTVIHTDFGTGMHDNKREGGSGGATKADLLGEDWRTG